MEESRVSQGEVPSAPLSTSEYLRTIAWGPEVYPVEKLALGERERALLTQMQTGISVRQIAASQHASYRTTLARSRVAIGKLEARAGLDGPITALPPLARRVVVLNELLGVSWHQKGHVLLINLAPDVIIERSAQFDELLGGMWRKQPSMLAYPYETVKERAVAYDALLGTSWRSLNGVITSHPDTIKQKVAQYDAWFGSRWRTRPALLTNSPQTLIRSSRALRALDITQENTLPGLYFGLLGTSVAAKRKKIAAIRRELLGHQQVYEEQEKRPLSAVVAARQGRTADEKAQEAREIAELKVFLGELGLKHLASSMDVIRAEAHKRGYPRPPG